MAKIPVEERFWHRVLKTETCWIWQGARVIAGHGQIKNSDGKNILTHRLSWELLRGPIPPGAYLLHSCDNPPCVNPDHLRVGTAAENNIDWRLRGRGFPVERVAPLKKKRSPEERFWERVQKSDNCWLWTGQKLPFGHGRIGFPNATSMLAHRFSWELVHGKVPDDLCVLHRCDNPSCVNPDHLFLGTRTDNMVDKVSKNRQSRGEMLKSSRLTEEQVREIRVRHARSPKWRGVKARQDPDSVSKMAADYGVSTWAIIDAMKGRRWKHIEMGNG